MKNNEKNRDRKFFLGLETHHIFFQFYFSQFLVFHDFDEGTNTFFRSCRLFSILQTFRSLLFPWKTLEKTTKFPTSFHFTSPLSLYPREIMAFRLSLRVAGASLSHLSRRSLSPSLTTRPLSFSSLSTTPLTLRAPLLSLPPNPQPRLPTLLPPPTFTPPLSSFSLRSYQTGTRRFHNKTMGRGSMKEWESLAEESIRTGDSISAEGVIILFLQKGETDKAIYYFEQMMRFDPLLFFFHLPFLSLLLLPPPSLISFLPPS